MNMEKSMSDELYYRGSCSYEMAVKNRLDQLERSGARNATAMLDGVRNMEYGIRSDLRKSTYSIVASQELLAETFQQGFDSVNNTLSFGFERINDSITAMTEVICDKLDKIHDILNNPRLTAARELYRRAATNFEKGYFEEALEDCLQAVEKEKTDYFSWYLLGNIYLYGAGKFSNTINLSKAEEAFYIAAKYIDADIESSDEAKEFASQIYYGLGHTKLIMSNDLLVDNKLEESQKKIEESEKAFDESLSLDGDNVKAGYDYAKVLHFLEKDDKVLELVDYVIGIDEKTSVVFINDKNFESIWNKIEEIINKKKNERIASLKQEVKNKIDDFFSEWDLEGEFYERFLGLKSQSDKEIDGYETMGFLSICTNKVNIIQKYIKLCEELLADFENWADEQHEVSCRKSNYESYLIHLNFFFKTAIFMIRNGGGVTNDSLGVRKYLRKNGSRGMEEAFVIGSNVRDCKFVLYFPDYLCKYSFDFYVEKGNLEFRKEREGYSAWWPEDVFCKHCYHMMMVEPDEYTGSLPRIEHLYINGKINRRTINFTGKLEEIISIANWVGYTEIIDTVRTYEIERNKLLDKLGSFGCFITTATCQSRHLPDNCHELETLRKFRDTFMKKNQEMKAEVEEYYQIAPVICKNISRQKNSTEVYDSIWNDYLKSAVAAVDNGENQKAHDIYKKMVLDLKEKWF